MIRRGLLWFLFGGFLFGCGCPRGAGEMNEAMELAHLLLDAQMKFSGSSYNDADGDGRGEFASLVNLIDSSSAIHGPSKRSSFLGEKAAMFANVDSDKLDCGLVDERSVYDGKIFVHSISFDLKSVSLNEYWESIIGSAAQREYGHVRRIFPLWMKNISDCEYRGIQTSERHFCLFLSIQKRDPGVLHVGPGGVSLLSAAEGEVRAREFADLFQCPE